MFAASSLVVAVLATYASVAVLSLTASAPSFLGSLPGVAPLVSGLGWSQPKVASLLTPARSRGQREPRRARRLQPDQLRTGGRRCGA